MKIQRSVSELLTRANKNLLSKEDRMLETQRGMMAGLQAKERGAEKCSEIILQQTLALNFDFLKGFNSVIGKDMAKKAYEMIGK